MPQLFICCTVTGPRVQTVGWKLLKSSGVALFPWRRTLMYTASIVASTALGEKKKKVFKKRLTIPSRCSLLSTKMAKHHMRKANSAIYSFHLFALGLSYQSLHWSIVLCLLPNVGEERLGPQGSRVENNEIEMVSVWEFIKYCWDSSSFSSATNEPIRLRLVFSWGS